MWISRRAKLHENLTVCQTQLMRKQADIDAYRPQSSKSSPQHTSSSSTPATSSLFAVDRLKERVKRRKRLSERGILFSPHPDDGRPFHHVDQRFPEQKS